MTDFLEDLNIVAIPAQPKVQSTGKRTKKNNKYERRRQKAKRARQQQQQQQQQIEPPIQHVPHEEQHDSRPSNSSESSLEEKSVANESNPTSQHVASSTTSGGIGNEPKSASEELPKLATETEPSSTNDNTKETSKTADKLSTKKNAKSSTGKQKTDSRKENEGATSAPSNVKLSKEPSKGRHSKRAMEDGNDDTFDNADDAGAGSSSSSAKPTRTMDALDDEQERAKYMAEFHARPMELDRRSGARSVTIVSKNSLHIFDDTQKDWESLGIHPRLIQTLKTPQFGSLHQPTTIQSRTIQAFQSGAGGTKGPQNQGNDNTTRSNQKNILIHSETGSGKTLAYVLPILQFLAFGSNNNSDAKVPTRSEMGCRCIILCPTRELASQTLQVVERLCQANFAGRIVPGGLLGGDSRHSEKSRLRKGLGVIVATPGRLLDHLHKTQSLALSLKGKLQWLVLDECDRLLDMGLGDQVRQIVQWMRANEASKQQPWWRSVLVSATVTPSVQALAKERMLCGNQEWVWVRGENGDGSKSKTARPSPSTSSPTETAKNSNSTNNNGGDNDDTDATCSENYSNSTPRQLAQFHLTVTAKLRLSALVSFLVQRVSKGERTVVFMGTCATVDYHYQLFNAIEESLWDNSNEENEDTASSNGLFGKKAQVFRLHGNVPHPKRIETMKEFSTTGTNTKKGAAILLTTDVAARGLNLEGIDWTVQYDPPCEIADYVHRVGRVARAGKAGHSLLFLLPSERKYLEVLETKGINNLNPLSLSSLLNQAAAICTEWTRAGVEQGGGSFSAKKPQTSNGYKGSRSGEFFSAEVQRRLEECVVQDDIQTRKQWKEKQQEQRKRKLKGNKEGRKEGELLAMAREAFLSFLRAYSTKKEPVVRSIFSSRALHLGHVAKSFALKEPPKSVASKQKSKKQQHKEALQDIQSNLPRSLEFGEAPEDYERLLAQVENHRTNIMDRYDDDEDDFRSKKRQKLQKNGKPMSAKALLLANATKMQNNLMDAM